MDNNQDIRSIDAQALKVAFGKVVYRHRLNIGIEQRPFSRMSGVGNSHLRRIEAGEASPTLTTIAKIASAFAVEPADLLDETYRLMEQDRHGSRS